MELLRLEMVLPDWTAPPLTGDAAACLPAQSSGFGADIWYVLRTALLQALPQLRQCAALCLCVVAVMLLLSVIRGFAGTGKGAAELAGVVMLSTLLLSQAEEMVSAGVETVETLAGYTTLLLPPLAATLAAQGGTTSSGALYTLSASLSTLAGVGVKQLVAPAVYVFLVLAVIAAACGEETLCRLRDLVKKAAGMTLKTLLWGYTAFLSLTGLITGAADQAAVKATKMTISGAVPVVGGILSDASETILVSAGMVKNSVGIYGLVAVVAICAGPVLSIGLQYGLVKATAAVCAMFAGKKQVTVLADFAAAMALLLAMTVTVGLLLLFSILSFLKGMSG